MKLDPPPPLPSGPDSHAVRPPDVVGTELECAFRTLLLASMHRLQQRARQLLGEDELAARCPFLADYGTALDEAEADVEAALATWVQATGWPAAALELWFACGLVEEDARCGDLFEALDPASHARRPTAALMQAWWGTLPGEGAGAALRWLLDAGLLRPCAPGAARADQLYEVEECCWLAARGEPPARPQPGVRLLAAADAPRWDALCLPTPVLQRLDALLPRLATGGVLLVRGPQHNGRHSLLAALARAEGRASLLVDWPLPGADGLAAGSGAVAAGQLPRWLGALATLTGARPVLRVQAAPGEALALPLEQLGTAAGGWVGVACGDADAFELSPEAGPVWSLSLALPDRALRHTLLARHAPPALQPWADALADRLHLSSGHLVQALRLEAGAPAPTAADSAVGPAEAHPRPDAHAAALAARCREAALAAGSAALAGLAQRLDGLTEPGALIVDEDLRAELAALEDRCRQREALRTLLPSALAQRLNSGVRALLAGPSGTGKTLAAQVLAGRLALPLYRLDLSSVVSKYIGETERNLHRVLDSAEALDVMLLLDEGDALLARRTEVGNAHDRYANLETSFLLQRLESHRGLVLVTTNALERIDSAFLRRFDHLLHFRAPEPQERLALWHAHLPARHHVTAALLDTLAEACALAGGQIRNVALAAASAALSAGRMLDDPMLVQAVRREYRRSGQLCPLAPG